MLIKMKIGRLALSSRLPPLSSTYKINLSSDVKLSDCVGSSGG